MNSFTITVTEAHLKKAIEAMNRMDNPNICTRCVVAQALNEVPDLGFESVGFFEVDSTAGTFDCPEAVKLTGMAFNDVMRSEPERISALLPLTLTFTRRN